MSHCLVSRLQGAGWSVLVIIVTINQGPGEHITQPPQQQQQQQSDVWWMFRIQLTESFQANLFSLSASNQTITVSSFNLICIINSHSQQTEEMGLGRLVNLIYGILTPKLIISKILIWFWWKRRLGSWLINLTDPKMGYLLWSTKRWQGSREGLVLTQVESFAFTCSLVNL